MAGIGLIIFGVSIALFGYVLIACAVSDKQHYPNRSVAEVIEISPLNFSESRNEFFKVMVKYFVNTEPIVSTFIIHSPVTYQIGSPVEILFNPNKPSQIISSNEPSHVSPLFIGLTIFGVILIIIGILLTAFGI